MTRGPLPRVAWYSGRALLGASLTLLALALLAPLSAQQIHQAGLIVVHGDGSVITRCVEFSEAQITGYVVLQRSGLDLNVEGGGMGTAICRIDGEGCSSPQEACFCKMEGGESRYWSYWRLEKGQWQYAPLGASNAVVEPGAIEGWVWGSSSVDPPPLPQMELADLCAPPIATATNTAATTATATLVPPAIDTPTPTATWTPAPTPSWTPTGTPTWTPLPAETPTGTPTVTPSLTATPAIPQIDFFTAERSTANAGEPVRLRWQVSQTAAVFLRDALGEVRVAAAGEAWVTPTADGRYLLVARSAGGESTAVVTIAVLPSPPAAAPTSEISAVTITPQGGQLLFPIIRERSPTASSLASPQPDTQNVPPLPPNAVLGAHGVEDAIAAEPSDTQLAASADLNARASPVPAQTAPHPDPPVLHFIPTPTPAVVVLVADGAVESVTMSEVPGAGGRVAQWMLLGLLAALVIFFPLAVLGFVAVVWLVKILA